MADREIDRDLLDRLTRSLGWREFLTRELVPRYLQMTHALDTAREDHRYLQGVKEGLRMAIEQPYVLTEQPSPLTLSATVTRSRPRGTEKPTHDKASPVVTIRQSYLA